MLKAQQILGIWGEGEGGALVQLKWSPNSKCGFQTHDAEQPQLAALFVDAVLRASVWKSQLGWHPVASPSLMKCSVRRDNKQQSKALTSSPPSDT